MREFLNSIGLEVPFVPSAGHVKCTQIDRRERKNARNAQIEENDFRNNACDYSSVPAYDDCGS